ncbi:hypothetical protein MNBD_ALPHA07-428 [hydrothermal vent metagenome]|uniref:Outer membrane protein beta-barrel domain-containing protein n=1 Tax=hydrothermal vent metagenome TaxID=652676 RepID=A0A3B0SP51_9ZZZZ
MKRLFTSTVSVMALVSLSGTVQAQVADPAPIVSTYDWAGFYAGINLGVSNLGPNPTAAGGFVQPKSSGIIGGGQVGYNYQINNLVLGLEGDFSAANLNRSQPRFNPVFGTGGVAFLDYNGFTQRTGSRFSDSKTFTGWTIGGGVEYAWTDNIIVGAEASYIQFPRKTLNYDTPYSPKPDQFTARERVSFKF